MKIKYRDLSAKAIIAGNLVDVVGTNIVNIPLIFYVFVTNNLSDLPKEQISSMLISLMSVGPIHYVSALLGSILSVLGGYLAAKIAFIKNKSLYLNGALSSIFCVSTGIYEILTNNTHSIIYNFSFLVLSPALAILGAYIFKTYSVKKSN